MITYLKATFINTFEFLKDTRAYFRDVLLLHGFMLFILLPSLASMTRFILRRGAIDYISSDNILSIITQHPGVLAALIGVLLLIILSVFFEFTFLLISMYFIKVKEPITLKQLLQMTIIQIKKVRISTVIFFLFYFFLLLPIGGLSFNSDLLSRIRIPSFILDFIFANRVVFITSALIGYLLLAYLSIRVIFALPEIILRDRPFRQAIRESWQVTKRKFFAILGRFLFISGTLLAISSLGFFLVLNGQRLVEAYLPDYSLPSAVIAMTILQAILLLNIVLSTVGIFFTIIDFMHDEGFLPSIPKWFYREEVHEKKEWSMAKISLVVVVSTIFGIGVGAYNINFLTSANLSDPLTFSHRGVSTGDGVQNTLASLERTLPLHPDYVEMDVQLTKDKQFAVYHDFDLRSLTGNDGKIGDYTLAELQEMTLSENGKTDSIASFDDYLAVAEKADQKLLIEIKTQATDVTELVSLFLEKYQETVLEDGDLLQSLNFQVVQQLKQEVPELTVGYILPFNIVGPPTTNADFLTMEYSTINRNFVTAAHDDGKDVYVWTVNDADSITRMTFYGVDGIITDNMTLLNQTLRSDEETFNYSDQLFYFVVGVG